MDLRKLPKAEKGKDMKIIFLKKGRMETKKEKLIKTLEDEMRRSSIPFPKGSR